MCIFRNGNLSQNSTEHNGYVNFNYQYNIDLLPQVNIGMQQVKLIFAQRNIFLIAKGTQLNDPMDLFDFIPSDLAKLFITNLTETL